MKTKRFCDLIEAAIRHEFPETESEFDRVPYIPEEGGEMRTCLGIFLHDGVHMATVAARAMYFIYEDRDGVNADELDMDEALGDFADLMGGMKIAPYMQWHCAYFPGLTAEQVLAESEAGDEPRIYGLRLEETMIPGATPNSVFGETAAGTEAATDIRDEVDPHTMFEVLTEANGVAFWYSGRNMMGRVCPAISGPLPQLRAAIASATVNRPKFAPELLQFHEDNLGHEIVYYFPNLSKTED